MRLKPIIRIEGRGAQDCKRKKSAFVEFHSTARRDQRALFSFTLNAVSFALNVNAPSAPGSLRICLYCNQKFYVLWL